MNYLLIEVNIYLVRYEKSMGNVCERIVVVVKV